MGATDFEIRAWAATHGYKLLDSDDISGAIREAYAADQDQVPDDDWNAVEQAVQAKATVPPPATDPWSHPRTPWEVPASETNTGVDGFAVTGLVLGIIPVLGGILGIVFGAIAINRTKTGRRGRGIAIAGVVLGTLWLIGLITGAALAISHRAGDVPTSNVRLGDCLNDFSPGVHATVKVVPCTDTHGAEVFAVVDLTGTSYPGDANTKRLAAGGCLKQLPRLVQPAVARDPGYAVGYLRPTKDSWAQGDREVSCLIYRSDGSKVNTSVAK